MLLLQITTANVTPASLKSRLRSSKNKEIQKDPRSALFSRPNLGMQLRRSTCEQPFFVTVKSCWCKSEQMDSGRYQEDGLTLTITHQRQKRSMSCKRADFR